MPSTILRILVLALVACGISGALLYRMQSPRTRTAPTIAARVSESHARLIQQRDLHDAEAQITRRIADLPAPATPSRPAPGATPVARQFAGDSSEELDLNDPALRLPLARLALSAVGLDDLADHLWLLAINDPDLPAEARKDLIEDLNEDGFADPKNLTHDDLPLIEARLALIDRLAPDAIDKTNADAFAEARKDLRAMHDKLVAPPALPPPAPDAPKPDAAP